MTMETPETDHLENELGSVAKFSHPIIWRHARQLERERDEARHKYNNLATEHMLVVNKLCGERDEAVEEVRLLKGILDVLKKEAQ